MARLGLGEAWMCKFANDFDDVKARTYRDNFEDAGQHFHEGDVWDLSTEDLPDRVDLAWASSPCQDFSLAGARAGLSGTRSSAFFGFWNLIQGLAKEQRQPPIIVIENVTGILTSHGGADFNALAEALAAEGYSFGAIEIDAARFVPQSRPRVFVIASLKTPPPSLTQVEFAKPFHSQRIVAAYDRLNSDLKKSWVWWHLNYPPAGNHTLDSILEPDSAVAWHAQDRTDALLGLLSPLHKEKLAGAKKRGVRTVGTLFRRMRIENKLKVQRAELRFDGYAGCLRTSGGGSSRQFAVVVDGDEVRTRLLTPLECGRLMGLESAYKLPKRATAALSVLGDGVVVQVVEFLRQNILDGLVQTNRISVDAEAEKRKVANSG